MEFNNKFYHPKDKFSSQRLRKASNKNYCKLEVKRFERLHDILFHIFQDYTCKEDGFLEIIKASLEIFFIEFVRQNNRVCCVFFLKALLPIIIGIRFNFLLVKKVTQAFALYTTASSFICFIMLSNPPARFIESILLNPIFSIKLSVALIISSGVWPEST